MIQQYKAVIIDDMQLSVAYLLKALSQFPEIGSIGTALTAETGESIIMEMRPDILFLDIKIDDKNGFDLYEKIKPHIDWQMYIIVYSSYEQYAIEAFKYSVFAFLKKPFLMNDLADILNRIYEDIHKQKDDFGYSHSTTKALDQKCMIKTATGSQLLLLSQIVYFEYNNETSREEWSVVLTNKQRHTLKRNTKAKTILGYSPHFVQVNQWQIINSMYFSKIVNDNCILHTSHHPADKQFIITRTFFKILQKKVLNI